MCTILVLLRIVLSVQEALIQRTVVILNDAVADSVIEIAVEALGACSLVARPNNSKTV